LERAGASSAAIQAAVWIITDNADYDDLGTLVSRSTFQITGGDRAIREQEAAQAMMHIQRAGVDLEQKAVWRDRFTICRAVLADAADVSADVLAWCKSIVGAK
jgi:hypothetical protein